MICSICDDATASARIRTALRWPNAPVAPAACSRSRTTARVASPTASPAARPSAGTASASILTGTVWVTTIRGVLPSIHGRYNSLSTLTACRRAGGHPTTSTSTLSGYSLDYYISI